MNFVSHWCCFGILTAAILKLLLNRFPYLFLKMYCFAPQHVVFVLVFLEWQMMDFPFIQWHSRVAKNIILDNIFLTGPKKHYTILQIFHLCRVEKVCWSSHHSRFFPLCGRLDGGLSPGKNMKNTRKQHTQILSLNL